MSPELLADFANQLFTTCKVEVLTHGNFTLQEAQGLLKSVQEDFKAIGSRPLRSIPYLETREDLHSTPNESLSGFVHLLEALESTAHSAEMFFEIGPDNLEHRVIAQIIEQILKESIYAELRSKRQLGYSLKSGIRNVCGTLGFVIELTSDRFGPELLCDEIDAFLHTFRADTLENLSSEAFLQHLSAIAVNKLEKELSLGQETLKHWLNILGNTYYGTSHEWSVNISECHVLRTMSKDRVCGAFDKWLHPASVHRKKATVIVVGSGYDVTSLAERLHNPCVTVVEDISDHFKFPLKRVDPEGDAAERRSKRLSSRVNPMNLLRRKSPVEAKSSPTLVLSAHAMVDAYEEDVKKKACVVM